MKIFTILAFLMGVIYPFGPQELFHSELISGEFSNSELVTINENKLCRQEMSGLLRAKAPLSLLKDDVKNEKIEQLNIDYILESPVFSFFNKQCLLNHFLLQNNVEPTDDEIELQSLLKKSSNFIGKIKDEKLPKQSDLVTGPYVLNNFEYTKHQEINFDGAQDVFIYDEVAGKYEQVTKLKSNEAFYLPLGVTQTLDLSYVPNHQFSDTEKNRIKVNENVDNIPKKMTVPIIADEVEEIVDKATTNNIVEDDIEEFEETKEMNEEDSGSQTITKSVKISVPNGFQDVRVEILQNDQTLHVLEVTNEVSIDLVPGEYKVVATQTHPLYERYISFDLTITESSTDTVELLFKKIEGEITITVVDDNTKAIELYKLVDNRREHVETKEVKQKGESVTFTQLDAGEYVVKKIEKQLSENRNDLITVVKIDQPSQKVTIEAKEQKMEVLANTGEWTREKIIIGFVISIISFSIIFLNKKRVSIYQM